MLRPSRAPVWEGLLARRKALLFASLFFLVSIPQTLLLTVVPLQAHDLLEDARWVSLLYFGVGIIGLAGRLLIPWLTHRLRRRWVFTLGAVCLLLASAAYASHTVPGLILGLGASVFAYACLEVTLNLYVLDQIARQDLGRFEPIRIFIAAGPWTIGPWLGVHLQATIADWVPFALAGAAAVLIAAWFWVLRLGERSAANGARPAPNPLRYLPRYFAQPRLRLAWALAAGRSGWWGMYFVYAPIFAVTSGLGKEIGGMLVSLGAGWIWFTPLWGWLARRYGLRRLLLVGYAGGGLLSLAGAVAIGAGWPGAIVLLAAALATATIDGAGNILFLRAVHPYERAEMTTVFVSYRDIAQLAPPGVFALLLMLFKLPAVFAAGGVAMLLLARLTRHIPRRL